MSDHKIYRTSTVFPVPGRDAYKGMTIREHMATQFMCELIKVAPPKSDKDTKVLADTAVRCANSLINSLND